MESRTRAVRLHYLDWLRVIAILGVVLYHAMHPFDLPGWHIKNAELSIELTIGLVFFGFWGMPFFFLVAGTGSWFALRRRTPSEYLAERTKRLVIPFIFGALVFMPIMMYFEWMHMTQKGAWTMPFQTFVLDRNVGFSPRWFGSLGYHLWFLGFLFSFAVLTLPLFQWLKRDAGQRVIAWLAHIGERRGGIFIFLLPLVVIKLALQPFFPLEHDWADFIFRMSFFILGFVLYADERFTQAIRRDWWLVVGAAILAFAILLAMFAVGEPFKWAEMPTTPHFYLIHGLVAVNGFGWTIFVLFIGMRFLDFTNRWLVYGQETVLPVFVVHQPVIIVIAFYVVHWQIGILPKLLTVVASSFIVSILLVELIIKRIGILRTLFGMTSSRVEPGKSISRPAHTGKVG